LSKSPPSAPPPAATVSSSPALLPGHRRHPRPELAPRPAHPAALSHPKPLRRQIMVIRGHGISSYHTADPCAGALLVNWRMPGEISEAITDMRAGAAPRWRRSRGRRGSCHARPLAGIIADVRLRGSPELRTEREIAKGREGASRILFFLFHSSAITITRSRSGLYPGHTRHQDRHTWYPLGPS
jgi:hypothetical protein